MASEVAPQMPLQQFFRRGAGRQHRSQELCWRLSEDLRSLDAAASASSSGGGEATLPPDAGGASGPRGDEQALRAANEGARAKLQVVLEAFREPAERGSSSSSAPPAAPAGQGDHEIEDAGELLLQFLAADLPVQLVARLGDMEFEVRKDVISVFSALLQLGPLHDADQQILEYVRGRPEFFQLLVRGYGRPEVATHCGMMLRSCARQRRLVEVFFERPEVVVRLIECTRSESFDVSSDAFSSLRDLLLTHRSVSAAYLEGSFRDFFTPYNGLLLSDDYVTQRQALNLLSEMLLDRTFMRVMLAYIGDEQYLQIHMNLLRADSKVIQCEAFHVFKIFVANPQKPPRVQQILFKNKDRLVKLLETLRPGAARPNRQDDKQFLEDKKTVIEKLQDLVSTAPKGTSSPTAADRRPGGGAEL